MKQISSNSTRGLLLWLLTLLSTSIFAQSTITGKVTAGDTKEPLAGVSILVQGTNIGTTTNQLGVFNISAGVSAMLVVSYIGYETQKISISGRTRIDVTLSTANNSLSEVVVVGYGQQSRKSLTSSIATVKTNELNIGAISNTAQLLQGKVAGLNITKTGDPNAAPTIILRGASTLREGAAQQPLFVIDGVVGSDISTIAPDDITAVDVLKDAAATAIYGSRAANGVIIVTTRRPNKGQTQVSYKGYAAVENISNTIEMMTAQQLKDYLTKAGKSLGPIDDTGADTDWQKEISRQGVSQNHNISFGGGNESTTYNASLNYFDQQGILKGSGLNRLIGRLSIDQKALKDKLNLGLSVSSTETNSTFVPFQDVVLENRLRFLPTVAPKDANGNYTENLGRSRYFNPLGIIENASEKARTKIFLSNFRATLKLPAGFSYDLSASYQNSQTNYSSYYNSYYTKNYSQVGFTTNYFQIAGTNGLALRNTYEGRNVLFENYITYNKTFGDHSVNAIIGYSYQQTTDGDGFQSTNTNFPTDDTQANSLGLGNNQAVSGFLVDYGGNNYSSLRLISDYARLNYSYGGKYFLQTSVRRDGSSAFGANNRWGIFPAVSAAWGIDSEDFMKNQTIFNELKLRVSYGVTGNSQGFNPLISLLRYGKVGTFFYNGSTLSAIGVVQNPNPDLRWEKTTMANIGIDFGILGNKLTGSLEIYNKRTTDLIWTYDVDPSVYLYRQLTANAGEMSNKGIELTLNSTVIKKGNLRWNTSLNMSSNKNVLVSLKGEGLNADSILVASPNGGGQTGSTVQVLVSGQPIGQFFTFRYAGKDDKGVSQYYDNTGKLTYTPRNKNDYAFAGNAQPKLLLGWTNNVSYKNIDLNVFFRGVFGHKIMNAVRADFMRPQEGTSYNITVEAGGESFADYNAYKYSDRFIEKGDYIRLDNASLGYTIRFKNDNSKSIRLYVAGNNLFILTGYKGIDPEITMGGLTPGVDWTRFGNGFYPKTRTLMAGLNVNF